ncbi:MAG: hypothetical protein J0L84_21200 [Verrucomicrobia bacterium]|nr:hypothetical protein [Verrucomicrobiota bacterium]
MSPDPGSPPVPSIVRADSWAVFLEARRSWVPWVVFLLGILALTPSIWSETSVTGSDEYTLTLRTPLYLVRN